MLIDYCAATIGLSYAIVTTVSLCILAGLRHVTFALDFWHKSSGELTNAFVFVIRLLTAPERSVYAGTNQKKYNSLSASALSQAT